MKYLKVFENFRKEEIITVYHGGNIEGDIIYPIYLTDSEYVAKGYGDEVYEFKLDISNFLDLTNNTIWVNLRKGIYDNFSTNFKKYRKTDYSYTKERKEDDYNILSKFKNYEEIYNRYNEIIECDFFQDVFQGDFIYSSHIGEIFDIYSDDSYREKRGVISEFLVLETVVRNLGVKSDYTLNTFQKYYYDYILNNKFDGYLAYSTDISGKNRIVEYFLINAKVLY